MAYPFKPISHVASATLSRESHANGPVNLFNLAAGMTLTLPAATGTGDVYDFFVLITLTSSGVIIVNADPGTDIMQGGVAVNTDIAGVTVLAIPTADTLTMSGTTTGGLKGSHCRLVDVASGVWQVSGFLVSSGVEATPFTATVAAP